MVALAHSAPYTVADLFEMPDDGSRYEVLDGQLIVSPAPSVCHQVVADAVRNLLATAAPAGVRAVTAVAVRCGDETTGMIPDVVVARFDPLTAGLVLDADQVLAVVEVVSPSTRRTDRATKPEVYAAAGIGAFWRIELAAFRGQTADEGLPVILAYQLAGERYQLAARLGAGRPGEIPVPYPVKLDPAELLTRG